MNIFGEKFMKYWYGAAIIIAIFMILSMANDASVNGYKLSIFNADGTVKTDETIVATSISEQQLDNLPVEKLFVPEKRF